MLFINHMNHFNHTEKRKKKNIFVLLFIIWFGFVCVAFHCITSHVSFRNIEYSWRQRRRMCVFALYSSNAFWFETTKYLFEITGCGRGGWLIYISNGFIFCFWFLFLFSIIICYTIFICFDKSLLIFLFFDSFD